MECAMHLHLRANRVVEALPNIAQDAGVFVLRMLVRGRAGAGLMG